MAEMMAKADHATATWEWCYWGLPTVCITVSESQGDISDAVDLLENGICVSNSDALPCSRLHNVNKKGETSLMYKCLKKDGYYFQDYSIISIRKEDIFLIKTWRNDQMNILRQKKIISDEDQIQYYNHVIKPTFLVEQPNMIIFSFLKMKECIGYGGLTNIDWTNKRAEVSFLLSTERTINHAFYQEEFVAFLSILKTVAFEQVMLNRLFTETYDIRPYHVQALEKSGFLFEGRLKENVLIGDRYVDSLMHGLTRTYYKQCKFENRD